MDVEDARAWLAQLNAVSSTAAHHHGRASCLEPASHRDGPSRWWPMPSRPRQLALSGERRKVQTATITTRLPTLPQEVEREDPDKQWANLRAPAGKRGREQTVRAPPAPLGPEWAAGAGPRLPQGRGSRLSREPWPFAPPSTVPLACARSLSARLRVASMLPARPVPRAGGCRPCAAAQVQILNRAFAYIGKVFPLSSIGNAMYKNRCAMSMYKRCVGRAGSAAPGRVPPAARRVHACGTP